MKSSVNWALLGLVIERPSYAYELAKRFERTYQDVLSLSSTSHVYTALGALTSRALIEEVRGTGAGRQPKPRYRATAKGVESYREWLVGQVREDRRRQRLFVLQLGALTRRPEAALDILERSEQVWLEEAGEIARPCIDNAAHNGSSDCIARLLSEEYRLEIGSKLSWLGYARRELTELAKAQGSRP